MRNDCDLGLLLRALLMVIREFLGVKVSATLRIFKTIIADSGLVEEKAKCRLKIMS
jgi:hypothetical protein